jgi:hypothetical protein
MECTKTFLTSWTYRLQLLLQLPPTDLDHLRHAALDFGHVQQHDALPCWRRFVHGSVDWVLIRKDGLVRFDVCRPDDCGKT